MPLKLPCWLITTLILVICVFKAFCSGRRGSLLIVFSSVKRSSWVQLLRTWAHQDDSPPQLEGRGNHCSPVTTSRLLPPRRRGAGPGLAMPIKPTYKKLQKPHTSTSHCLYQPAFCIHSFSQSRNSCWLFLISHAPCRVKGWIRQTECPEINIRVRSQKATAACPPNAYNGRN